MLRFLSATQNSRTGYPRKELLLSYFKALQVLNLIFCEDKSPGTEICTGACYIGKLQPFTEWPAVVVLHCFHL